MNCKDFRRDLETARDRDGAGSLAGLASEPLATHASSCPPCAALLLSERRLHEGLAAMRSVAHVPPPGFGASVRRRVREAAAAAAEPSRERALRSPAWRLGRWPVAASAMASAAAVAVIVLVAVRETSVKGPTATVSAPPHAAPVLWSNGRVEVVGQPAVETPPQQIATLVEYEL